MKVPFNRYSEFDNSIEAATPESMWRGVLGTVYVEQAILILGKEVYIYRLKLDSKLIQGGDLEISPFDSQNAIDIGIRLCLIACSGPERELLSLTPLGEVMYKVLLREREQKAEAVAP